MEKGEITQNEQFHLFPTIFSLQSVSLNPLVATFQLSSAASLNLGGSPNGVLRNGLTAASKPLAALKKKKNPIVETMDSGKKGMNPVATSWLL